MVFIKKYTCFRLFLNCFLQMFSCLPLHTFSQSGRANLLLQPQGWEIKAEISADKIDLILINDLLWCSFRLIPDLACYDFSNPSIGRQFIRII